MKISVITPTFNSEKTIIKNVESIINQSYKSFEHIIIDNLSSDKTIELVKNLYKDLPSNLTIISEKDSGISEAFNKGIKAASGDIITILNSDDSYYYDEVFSEAVHALSDSGKLIFHGDILFSDERFGSYIRKPLRLDKLTTMPLNHPTMFIKKEVYSAAGQYDTSYRYSMDFEFYCRLYTTYKNLDTVLVYFDKNPLVTMSAGGESWSNEIASINEVKSAVYKHKLIKFNLLISLNLRLFRTRLKVVLNRMGFNYPIKLWRKLIH